MVRKGITPVVAMVLLLFMTVAVAGGAYAWFSGIISQSQEETTQQLNTELVFKDIRCNSGVAELSIKNSGSTSLDGSDVDLFVRTMDGDLVTSRTGLDFSSAGFSSPGGFEQETVFLGNTLKNGRSYRFMLEFGGSDATASGTCQIDKGLTATIESCNTGGNTCNGEDTCDEQGTRIRWDHDMVSSLQMEDLTFSVENMRTGETCEFNPEGNWNGYSIDSGNILVLSTAEPQGSSWGCDDTTTALVGKQCTSNSMGGNSNHMDASQNDRFRIKIRHNPTGSLVSNVTDTY